MKKFFGFVVFAAALLYFVSWMPSAQTSVLLPVFRVLAIIGIGCLIILGVSTLLLIFGVIIMIRASPRRIRSPRVDGRLDSTVRPKGGYLIGYACPVCKEVYANDGYCSSLKCLTRVTATKESQNVPILMPVYGSVASAEPTQQT